MRVLILGGTRFTGRALAARLVDQGHEVTVSSRRPERAPTRTRVVGGERREAIDRLAAELFDQVLDFTAYDADSARHALSAFSGARYLLISSMWVTRLAPGMTAAAPAPVDSPAPSDLPEITRRYIAGKAAAEDVVRRAGGQACALRLPIVWGADDHTGRLAFYRARLRDGAAQILVDGGANGVQLLWSDDAADAIGRLIEGKADPPSILEAIPGPPRRLAEIVDLIAAADGRMAAPVSLSREILGERLPAYLEREPLWRERPLAAGANNLFQLAGKAATPLETWLERLVRETPLGPFSDDLRASEIRLLQDLGHA